MAIFRIENTTFLKMNNVFILILKYFWNLIVLKHFIKLIISILDFIGLIMVYRKDNSCSWKCLSVQLCFETVYNIYRTKIGALNIIDPILSHLSNWRKSFLQQSRILSNIVQLISYWPSVVRPSISNSSPADPFFKLCVTHTLTPVVKITIIIIIIIK